jgi:hypothetical protein
VSRALRSVIEPTWLSRLRTRWLLDHQDANDRLALLRRLVARHVDGVLPGLRETRVEQSWNEQIFARVLGYQTLFSHDRLPYHLEPKRHSGGRYSDFSIGWFGDGPDRAIASAELKGPGADLDAPQSGYDGMTPVEQAVSCAVREGTPWALVSNFNELRLYRASDAKAVAVARLDRVRDNADLAFVAAVFGRRGLLGDDMGKSDLEFLLQDGADHPALPIPGAADCVRAVFRYQPPPDQGLPLHLLEADLVKLLPDADWQRFAGSARRVKLVDGWLVAEGTSSTNRTHARLAVNSSRELVLSVRLPPALVSHVPDVRVGWLVTAAKVYVHAILAIERSPRPKSIMEIELLDVDGAKMFSQGYATQRCAGGGTSERAHIASGPFEAEGNVSLTASKMLLETAFYFRNDESGVLLDLAKVRKEIEE